MVLTIRLLLGTNVSCERIVHYSHTNTASVCLAVQMILTRLKETSPHQRAAVAAVSSLHLPHYGSAPRASHHRGLLGYFTDHNSQACSAAQQQRQALLPADQGPHSDWLRAACAAADAMHLLSDAYRTNHFLLSSGNQGGSWLC
jgi:hypothetical protein